MFKRVPGTRDILPGEVEAWQKLETLSRNIFSKHNYREIRPPLIEDASLFNRSLGESTEIVQKQMFLIKKEEDVYALRPEGTASIVRAYIENNLDKTHGFVKLFYMGPMFRMERPQKGRLRQFHHIGCEAVGSVEPDLDIEMISLADSLLKSYSIGGYSIVVNSLGCAEDKKALNRMLQEKLGGRTGELCEDCKVRFQRNILRILDCKNDQCRAIVNSLDIGDSYLCQACKDHFSYVREGLDLLGVQYEVSPHLVRGLDYYTRTVFEFKHGRLGPQQDALGAGGRYDSLVRQLGGPDTGAIGFAFGVERLLLALQAGSPEQDQGQQATAAADLVYLITLGVSARRQGIKILSDLRSAGISADTDYEARSLKAAMRRANDLAARWVLILGDNELQEQAAAVKDMRAGAQEKVGLAGLCAYFKAKLQQG